mmetsp:Transcript_107189/g.300085  ORF Transcript_107189/g.300085 Transcript_107189/m.300085 type:complete len:223 (+) Transcript_107189:606-1274(+)
MAILFASAFNSGCPSMISKKSRRSRVKMRQYVRETVSCNFRSFGLHTMKSTWKKQPGVTICPSLATVPRSVMQRFSEAMSNISLRPKNRKLRPSTRCIEHRSLARVKYGTFSIHCLETCNNNFPRKSGENCCASFRKWSAVSCTLASRKYSLYMACIFLGVPFSSIIEFSKSVFVSKFSCTGSPLPITAHIPPITVAHTTPPSSMQHTPAQYSALRVGTMSP